jgi:UDP-galactopyranose mutase
MKNLSTSAGGVRAPTLVCFSQLRWGFVVQRPQHLMNRAAASARVIFWEEPMPGPDIAEPRLDRFPQPNGLEVITPRLPEGLAPEAEEAAVRVLLDQRLGEEPETASVIAWYITPMMLPFSRHIARSLTVYDNMDELSAFQNAPASLLALEEELLASADVVFTGGQSIYEAKALRHPNIHPMPSSIDKAHFGRARRWNAPEPAGQAGIPRPRIGWFGVVDERMDLGLVERLADLRPDWQFIIIGPVVKIDPARLPQRANLHWLGKRDYEDLPAYLAGWDAGFFPAALNDATRFISPTKTPEFLAAGVPLVATPIRDIARPYGELGLVSIAETAEEMAGALDRALHSTGAGWLAKVDAFLADKSWDRTWSDMRRLMNEAQARKTASNFEVEAA